MRIGVDSGGTFTDLIAWDGSRLRSLKVRSTPDDPARAIRSGLSHFAAKEVVHGSTVATNALLQRNGARTAFVTTSGFEDLLELARQNRAHLYDWSPPERPGLVQAGKKFGISERILHDGTVLDPLSEGDVEALVEKTPVGLRIERGDVRLARACHEVLPSVDPIEDLEQQNPQDRVLGVAVAVVDHALQQVLTDPIRGSVGIRESVPS